MRLKDQRDVTGLTYPEVAARFGVELCDRECMLRSIEAHTTGIVGRGRLIHWKDRIVVRPGLYNFLKLVAESQTYEEWPNAPRVAHLWMASSGAYSLGITLGVRFPRELAATDRAKVREELVWANGALDRELKEKIERWAREAPG